MSATFPMGCATARSRIPSNVCRLEHGEVDPVMGHQTRSVRPSKAYTVPASCWRIVRVKAKNAAASAKYSCSRDAKLPRLRILPLRSSNLLNSSSPRSSRSFREAAACTLNGSIEHGIEFGCYGLELSRVRASGACRCTVGVVNVNTISIFHILLRYHHLKIDINSKCSAPNTATAITHLQQHDKAGQVYVLVKDAGSK